MKLLFPRNDDEVRSSAFLYCIVPPQTCHYLVVGAVKLLRVSTRDGNSTAHSYSWWLSQWNRRFYSWVNVTGLFNTCRGKRRQNLSSCIACVPFALVALSCLINCYFFSFRARTLQVSGIATASAVEDACQKASQEKRLPTAWLQSSTTYYQRFRATAIRFQAAVPSLRSNYVGAFSSKTPTSFSHLPLPWRYWDQSFLNISYAPKCIQKEIVALNFP